MATAWRQLFNSPLPSPESLPSIMGALPMRRSMCFIKHIIFAMIRAVKDRSG
jgi:hypothetical protein